MQEATTRYITPYMLAHFIHTLYITSCCCKLAHVIMYVCIHIQETSGSYQECDKIATHLLCIYKLIAAQYIPVFQI